jgi:hypothetical protein
VTLISSIIADAYRESNLLPLGKAATTPQVTEALRLLNALFSSVYGDEAGEMLHDWPLGNYGRESAEYNIPLTDEQIEHPIINRRLIAVNEAARTIYLTPYPQDGARMGIADPFGRLATYPVTLDANGRTIEAAATILLSTNGMFREWFYRADLGQWVRLTDKIETDEMPFPSDFDNFFITLLALRLNPRYGREMDQQSAMIYKSERRKFVARYVQSLPLEALDDISWPFMSRQSYGIGREFSSNRAFNRGSYHG